MVNRKNIFKSLILLFILAILTSGCSISFKGSGSGGNDGGIYASTNKGNSWRQKVLVPTISGRPKSIGALNISSLVMDPSDRKAIYFGSIDNGLFYSYNSTQEWRAVESLGKITITEVAVDPSSKCIIYIATANKIYKSTDCARTWSQVYYDNDINTRVSAIAVDHYDSANIYIGTSRGEVIKSTDRGVSWQTIKRLDDAVKKILISPHDSRVIFAATSKKGIFRTTNSGQDWVNLRENLAEFKSSFNFRDLVIAKSEKNIIMLASNYGLIKSKDNGESWSRIELITPEKASVINAVAISPKDVNEIYYVTNTTFYRSLDGGQNWTTKKLPTTRAGWKLLVDPENTSIIYLGVRSVK